MTTPTTPTAGQPTPAPTRAATPAGAAAVPAAVPAAAVAAGCPRCHSTRTVSYGARCGCCACGATWQALR